MQAVAAVKQEKAKEVQEILERALKYEIIAVADLRGIGTKQLQIIRKQLSGRAEIKISKNTLLRKAVVLAKEKNPAIGALEELLVGPNVIIFTNMNPFELTLFLDKNRVPAPAKPGDIATETITVYGGNTGFPPGPILSKFGKAKIPTRIEEGAVWIAKDTDVAEPGDAIGTDLAEILTRMGVLPMRVGLTLKVVYDKGVLIKPELLKIDLPARRQELLTASRNALGLALAIVYPVPEVLRTLIVVSRQRALSLAVEAGFVTPETAPIILGKAQRAAESLSAKITPSN